ncbi:MAG: branched-chain amino acid ABC transporter permease [Dehalococcoidales bacterium]|nr:branched-chain amino acid ABC transporter permease [Dehalococcoidales bacterium]
MSVDQFLQYLISGITQGSIYALVALGFTIIYAVTRVINFAQGEFVMLGGMLSFLLISSFGIPLIPSLILAVLFTAIIGAIIYLLAIRTAKKASVVSLIIITIGVSIFIRGFTREFLGVDSVRPPFFTGDESLTIFGALIRPQALWIIGTTIVVTIILHLFLSRTMMGNALKASAISTRAAAMVGIDSRVMALTAFVIAAVIGSIGGAVMAPLVLTSYNVGVMLGLKGFVSASIGGFKSPIISVIGGITIGVIESLAVGINWGPFTSSYKDAIAIVALLIILLIRSGRLALEERAD